MYKNKLGSLIMLLALSLNYFTSIHPMDAVKARDDDESARAEQDRKAAEISRRARLAAVLKPAAAAAPKAVIADSYKAEQDKLKAAATFPIAKEAKPLSQAEAKSTGDDRKARLAAALNRSALSPSKPAAAVAFPTDAQQARYYEIADYNIPTGQEIVVQQVQETAKEAISEMLHHPNVQAYLKDPVVNNGVKELLLPLSDAKLLADILAVDQNRAQVLIDAIKSLPQDATLDVYLDAALSIMPEELPEQLAEYIHYLFLEQPEKILALIQTIGGALSTGVYDHVVKNLKIDVPAEAINELITNFLLRGTERFLDDIRSQYESFIATLQHKRAGSGALINPFLAWHGRMNKTVLLQLLPIFLERLKVIFPAYLSQDPRLLVLVKLYTHIARINLNERELLSLLSEHIRQRGELLVFNSENLSRTVAELGSFSWQTFLQLNPEIEQWIKVFGKDVLKEQIRNINAQMGAL